MLKIGESFEVKVLLLDDDSIPVAGTLAYIVYDEADASFATGNMTAVIGVTGLYTMSFTPDAAGEWTVRLICLNPVRYAAKVFSVGKGVEQDTYNAIVALNNLSASGVWGHGTRTLTDPNSYKADVSALALEATLGTHDSDIKTLLTALQADLDSPNQYKANVASLALEATLGTHDSDIKTLLTAVQADLDSPNQFKANVASLALEASLTAIKGGGWTTETLKAIFDAIASLNDIAAADVWSTAGRTLTTPNDYKANVSALALEATVAGLNNLAQSDILDDATPFSGADIATILSAIQNGTYGLSALETLVDEIESLLKNVTYGLSALNTKLGTLATSTALTTHDTEVKSEINDNETKIDTVITNQGTHNTALGTHDTAIKALLEDGTHGLAALETLVDDIEGKTGSLPADPASQAKIISKMDFPSLPLQVTLTSTAGDRGLVDVVVSGLPTGITIIAVQGIVYCDSVENSFDGENYLESTKVQVKEKTAGTDRDAITLEANKILRFTQQMVRGGTVLTADWASATDAGILAEVIGNATYQMWFDVGETKENNIVLDGTVFMLRIWFY